MAKDSGISRRAVLTGMGSLAVAGAGGVAMAKGVRAGHPRLVAALKEMRDARHYLEVAPTNFNGHKPKAIAALTAAIEEIDLALDA